MNFPKIQTTNWKWIQWTTTTDDDYEEKEEEHHFLKTAEISVRGMYKWTL